MTMLPAAMSLLLEHLQMAYYEKYSVLKVEAVNMPFLNAVKMQRQNHAGLNFLTRLGARFFWFAEVHGSRPLQVPPLHPDDSIHGDAAAHQQKGCQVRLIRLFSIFSCGFNLASWL